MSFLLEFRSFDPETTGTWGPFDTRSQASDFASALQSQGFGGTWTTVPLKDPDSYTFSHTR